MYFKRVIDFDSVLERKSLFLLGPRQTGKSTLLRERYPDGHCIDLLNPALFRKFQTDLSHLGKEIDFQYGTNNQRLFIIDEIQKLPELLDEVHRQIELKKDVRFILTGSSARKLKKSGTNLLGGRASRFYFHPLVFPELKPSMYQDKLLQLLTFGLLPSIQYSNDPAADLADYVGLYLREEIQQEAIIRSLDGFSRFLGSVAQTNAQQVNFTELGNDAQVAPRTVREYYQVLEDTLVGHLLPAYTKTKKRKAMTSAKFYLFDPGVTNSLLGRTQISPMTSEFGDLFEQLVFCELKAYFDYQGKPYELFYWRSTSKFEVDFIVQTPESEPVAIEVKSSKNIGPKQKKGLKAFAEDVNLRRQIIVVPEGEPRIEPDSIEVLPLLTFLGQLWAGKL